MSRHDYPMDPKVAPEHEQEVRLNVQRKEWIMQRDNVLSELEYHRRAVAALETLARALDASIESSTPSLVAGGPNYVAERAPYSNSKSYEIGSGGR